MALIPQNLELLNCQKWTISTNSNGVTLVNNWFVSDYLSDNTGKGFLFISHCLRTIPDFQEENPEYKGRKENIKKETDITSEYYLRQDLKTTPKTIASATLHGQGEYPPSTLEELCESYKNVMSK